MHAFLVPESCFLSLENHDVIKELLATALHGTLDCPPQKIKEASSMIQPTRGISTQSDESSRIAKLDTDPSRQHPGQEPRSQPSPGSPKHKTRPLTEVIVHSKPCNQSQLAETIQKQKTDAASQLEE